MKLRTYQEMLEDYQSGELDSDDLNKRELLKNSHPYTVILEAGFMELDSLNEWIKMNFEKNSIVWIFYGKTGYDFGYAEYFGSQEFEIKKIRNAIPNIYTIYPDSCEPNQISKTNGYYECFEYSKEDQDAIIVKIKEGKN